MARHNPLCGDIFHQTVTRRESLFFQEAFIQMTPPGLDGALGPRVIVEYFGYPTTEVRSRRLGLFCHLW